jgi:thiol-disulfide isomerase/thioredoxin
MSRPTALRLATLSSALLAALLATACQRAAAPAPSAAPAASMAPAAAATVPAAHLAAVEDFAAGMAKAKAEGKAGLVDAWAPWCHTCLSMQNYVLNDPSLASLGERVVLGELDTDKPENAGVLEKYTVSVWPTFFVIDPKTGNATGLWPGSASVKEFRGFVEDGLAGIEAAGADPGSPAHHMVAARTAQAAGDDAAAAKHFEAAVQAADAGWPRRSEALMGWLFSLDRAKDSAACIRVGNAHLAEVQGAAVPADYSATLLSCADDAPTAPGAAAAKAAAIARLKAFTANPPSDASADDRADAWNILGSTLAEAGDKAGARHAQEMRLDILQKAAAGIEDPLLAQTFDYARAQAFVALDRGDEAVTMLEARERELPTSYEPPARLASALTKMNRLPQALVAYDRAIAKSYGPRQLLYMRQKADAQAKMGDVAGQVATLKAEVAGYEALAKGHQDPEGLADAKKRLAEAQARTRT